MQEPQAAVPAETALATPESAPGAAPPWIEEPMAVLAVLLAVLALLFGAARHRTLGGVFRVVPLLVFAYFVPTLLSNTGVIPLEAPLYGFIKKWLLPASLLLLTLSVDIPGILRLGPKVLALFLGATASIVIGGPLAYLALGRFVPPEHADQAWRGLAALSGSWIGGGANFLAIAEQFDVSQDTLSFMVVVDVAVASVWMATLLFFAGRQEAMDARVGADRRSIDALRDKVERYQAEVSRPTSLADLLMIFALAFCACALAQWIVGYIPETEKSIIKRSTWVVILTTTLGVALSFTRVRRLEGAGASAVGSVFLYLLVTTIGAGADFRKVVEHMELALVGALWMVIHAAVMLSLWRLLRAPIFFVAVGSQANVGGAASAPVVAGAFHKSLAPVGVLLAVGGYVLGTYAGILCGFLLRWVHSMIH